MLTKIFKKDYEKTPIGMTGSFRSNKGQKLVVEAKNLQQLLQHNECYKAIHDNKKYKVLRFLLRTNGELVFAHEGGPSGIVPAHWQMAGVEQPFDAKCLTAGNAYFNIEDNTLALINHKSGDFRPAFDSLQFVFPQLIEARIKMSDTLKIEQLNNSSCRVNKYQIKYCEILKYGNSEMPKNDEASEINEETDSSEELLLQAQAMDTAKEAFTQLNTVFLHTKRSCNKPSFTQTFFGINNIQEWQDTAKQLRQDALVKLIASVKMLEDKEDKIALIDHALNLPLFNEHRSNYLLTGAFGNTAAMTTLEALRDEFLEKEDTCCFF